MLDQKTLHELFEYRDGELYWKPRKYVNSNKRIGGVHHNGYLIMKYKGKTYHLHKLIYIIFHGEISQYVNHIDRNIVNNKIENLRAATKSQCQAYANKNKTNTSGYRGVCWKKGAKKWMASITVNYKRRHLGYFEDKEEARKAYCEAAKEHYGEFANLN